MRPVILLDLDGVAVNFIAGALPLIHEITGRLHHHDDVDQFMIEKALGLDAEQTAALYKRVADEGWCRGLPAYDGAKEGVEALQAFADVIPVTLPFDSPFWVREREAWVLEHLGIPREKVHHTHEKWRVVGDALVDDKVSHLVSWKEKHPHGRAVLFKRRYNQDGSWKGPTVEDWPHLVGSLEAYFSSRR